MLQEFKIRPGWGAKLIHYEILRTPVDTPISRPHAKWPLRDRKPLSPRGRDVLTVRRWAVQAQSSRSLLGSAARLVDCHLLIGPTLSEALSTSRATANGRAQTTGGSGSIFMDPLEKARKLRIMPVGHLVRDPGQRQAAVPRLQGRAILR